MDKLADFTSKPTIQQSNHPANMLFLQTLSVILGIAIIIWTLYSAVRAIVLPRGEQVFLNAFLFRTLLVFFRIRLKRTTDYETRDRVMAIFAPIGLLLTPVMWMALMLIGFTFVYWGAGVQPVREAFILSGSSLLTLGFARDENLAIMVLIFMQATIGLGLVALLITYLPSIYSAFSARERNVALLEVRAGSPPSAVEMLGRFNRISSADEFDLQLSNLYREWENWFAMVEESHTSLSALVFFRSPQPQQSWITAAGTVLDSAALYASTLQSDNTTEAALCLRAGFIALRRIAGIFNIRYDPNPAPTDPISITREEYDDACRNLAALGLPLRNNLDQAWRDFAGWRVNYDRVLLALAAFTMAPYAPWISDRSLPGMMPMTLREWIMGRIRRK
ncbi:MAG: hypothetical protein M9965_02260 [Anaerolineae bacterium]|nr:hypothetical protein [Anaerolineae bacterium]